MTPIDGATGRTYPPAADVQSGGVGQALILIDATTGRVMSMTPAAAAFFGMQEPHASSLPTAMPAWTAIRAFAAVPRVRRRHPALLFWTAAGPRACPAILETATSDDRAAVQVTLELDPPPPPQSPPPLGDSREQDLATLREIARRIREGAGEAGTATPPAAPAPTPDATPMPPPRHGPNRTLGGRPPPLDFKPPSAPRPVRAEATVPLTGAADAASALAKLVHELRTPLSAIVSLAEIMRDERLGAMGNARYKTYAADIHDCAQHTLDLVAALLAAERGDQALPQPSADTGMTPTRVPRLTHDRIDVQEIGRSCVSSLQPIATRNAVTLHLVPAPDLGPILADRRAIRQIMLNVLSNALRFTPAGGLITVATTRLGDGGVEIAISDTGTGMRPVDIAWALSDAPDSAVVQPVRDSDGQPRSGIGLPLVRELIEAHGGSLAITSAPGRGTRVAIVIPSDRVLRR